MEANLENMNTIKIAFYYPSKVIGGAELLFARLAVFLTKQINIEVYYIDYIDGFIRNNNAYKHLNFINFEDEIKTSLNDIDVLITPLSNIYRIEEYINFKNDETKLFFWSLHTFNVIHVMPDGNKLQNIPIFLLKNILTLFCKKNYKIYQTLLKEANDSDAVYFLDNNTGNIHQNIFNFIPSENILPIAIPEQSDFAKNELISQNEINVCILGRLSAERIFPTQNILENLNKISTNKKIKAHIIGKGDCEKQLYPKEIYKNIEIIMVGTLTPDQLTNYLKKNIDILFSAGTSLLEGASLKIPSVIIPFSYTKFNTDLFYYLFESSGFSIGESATQHRKRATRSFGSIIQDIYIKKRKKEIGQKCYEYYLNHHSIANTAKNLLNAINKCSLNYKIYKKIKSKIGKPSKNKNILFKIIKRFL